MYIYVHCHVTVIYVSYDHLTLLLLRMAVSPQHDGENAVSTKQNILISDSQNGVSLT